MLVAFITWSVKSDEGSELPETCLITTNVPVADDGGGGGGGGGGGVVVALEHSLPYVGIGHPVPLSRAHLTYGPSCAVETPCAVVVLGLAGGLGAGGVAGAGAAAGPESAVLADVPPAGRRSTRAVWVAVVRALTCESVPDAFAWSVWLVTTALNPMTIPAQKTLKEKSWRLRKKSLGPYKFFIKIICIPFLI